MMGAPAGPGLVVDVELRQGPLDLAVEVQVAPAEVVAVVGPNGAGKSTLLRIIAGLTRPDRGRVILAGTTLTDGPIQVPPQQRRVGMVFQDYLLFEHMSVRGNVAFGLGAQGGRAARRSAARSPTVAALLDRLDLTGHAESRPGALSGGQRQRVALARTLASPIDCLLLDEPLAALDQQARGEARRTLRAHLATFDGPVLMVTHEPLEALALADRVMVLEDGRITQIGSPQDVARHPRSDWVARLVGLNLFSGSRSAQDVALDQGGTIVTAGQRPGGAATIDPVADDSVLVAVHPRTISLHRERPSGSPRNVWQGTVQEIEFAGDRARVEVVGTPTIVAEVTAASVADLDLVAGGRIWVSFKAADVSVYSA